VVRDDLIGHDVNLTARLLEHCEPGEVLVTEDAKRLAEADVGSLRFSGGSRVKARGVPEPVAIYRAG
jgi:class 3 adenylate cyclase